MFRFKLLEFVIILSSIFLFACQEKTNKNESNNKPVVIDTALIKSVQVEDTKKPEPPLSYLLEYKGKYEFESKLLNNEPLKSRLKKAIGANYNYFMECCNVQSPIKIENGIVFIEGCQAHNCPGVFYVVYIDINSDKIFAGLYDNGTVSLYREGNETYPNWLLNWKDENEKEYDKYNTETSTYSERNVENFKIGDEVHVGNFVYLVRKIEFTKTVENTFTEQKADGIYLIVYLAVLNKSRESRTLSNSMFKVFDSDGYEYETSQNAITILVLNDQDKVFLFKDIPPKIPKEIIMPFEVPNSNDIYTLQVSGGFWTGETAKINLQN
ncbi:Hypothetical protein IALB_1351 [Ignavibacterium album JCM 16511]|uniref:DUF4352 domain-containing protein n=1 Tax=Ignavibacterium album (strain DSM 19864 / JCM 16511 / NBRC 101810 / Mat9-16) TaxID=945713 RepID=I0AJA4_IGNAJ|nr:DUF4352 domain-containing protein [Ignavibacterium album]AFH49061.1 Hypothetical protein IALB_1351 [Ignavibacterium album JCM 16511]